MSYNCECCGGHVRPGVTRRLHAVTRQVINQGSLVKPVRLEIARELAVCGACQVLLDGGLALHVVSRKRRQQRAEDAARQGEEPRPVPPPWVPPAPVAVALAVPHVPVARRVTFGKPAPKGGA